MPVAKCTKDPKHRRNSLDIDSSAQNGKRKEKYVKVSDMKDVVALNCKLTNEMLGMKKQLMDKNDGYIRMQKQYFEKDIECLKLKTSISEQAKKIDEMQKEIQALKDAQICTDLIQLTDDIEEYDGK